MAANDATARWHEKDVRLDFTRVRSTRCHDLVDPINAAFDDETALELKGGFLFRFAQRSWQTPVTSIVAGCLGRQVSVGTLQAASRFRRSLPLFDWIECNGPLTLRRLRRCSIQWDEDGSIRS